MKLSISNIAWSNSDDDEMYLFLKESSFSGIEIAPTRIFPDSPYHHLSEAKDFAKTLQSDYLLEISSMQSIWYGVSESIFGTDVDRSFLIDYTKKAIDFADVIGCGNLVFGCPKNRNLPDGVDSNIAIDFFRSVGDYAISKGTIVAIEPNPPIYNTNFINTTKEAFEFCKAIDNSGIKANVDLGTMIHNGETVEDIKKDISLVNHVHISEPYLELIEEREIHKQLKELDYFGYFSIEMKNLNNLDLVKKTIEYVEEVFN